MINALLDNLKQQNQNLDSLKAILEQELHLIGSRDAESLMSLLSDKEQLLTQIQTLDATTATQYTALVEKKASIPTEVTTLTETAKELLLQCQFRTQINKTAVEQGQLKLAHLRNLLMELRAKESLTYDKSGKTQGGFLGKGVSA
jgi:flagella synthesis protein FlgN